MIPSQLSKKLQQGLSKLRAITEPTIDTDSTTYSTVVTDTDEQLCNDHKQMLLDIWHDPISNKVDIEAYTCYGKITTYDPEDISSTTCKDFYQEIADAAKEWTDKPSDRKRIIDALEYVLDSAKNNPQVDIKLVDRLKREDMIRIVTKFVNYAK